MLVSGKKVHSKIESSKFSISFLSSTEIITRLCTQIPSQYSILDIRGQYFTRCPQILDMCRMYLATYLYLDLVISKMSGKRAQHDCPFRCPKQLINKPYLMWTRGINKQMPFQKTVCQQQGTSRYVCHNYSLHAICTPFPKIRDNEFISV